MTIITRLSDVAVFGHFMRVARRQGAAARPETNELRGTFTH